MDYSILSNLIITRVYAASTMYTTKNSTFKRANRERWAIIMKYEGESTYDSNGEHFVSNINHIMILPKGSSYTGQCTVAGHFSTIEFDSDSTCDHLLCFPVKNGEKIHKLFKDLAHKRTLRKPMYEMESIKDVYTILLALTQAAQSKYIPGQKQRKIEPALEYISENYHRHLTNDQLAKVAGMSTVYFRKLFTEQMGISPMAYTKQLRIDQAKQMLKSDYGTLSEVAQSLGYANLYDFSRDFKKHTGIAPSKY